YSKEVWSICTTYKIPLVYASSAATYGNGAQGFDDNEAFVPSLRPLNPYGASKQEFDQWVLQQDQKPPFWSGLKFFNVYGPNEYHKGRMASVIYQAYNQIIETNKIRLFKSYNPEYKNGEQKRDFIYVKDIVEVLTFMMETQKGSGIYNIGTSEPSTFIDLAQCIFKACNKRETIEFIEMPPEIKRNYQYFTCASISKLRAIGYINQFYSLERGVADYVLHYLKLNRGFSLQD
ncbi:MAG: ADP-glyceromanno-heptose 6-epimerase, partial [Marivirga sp.]|nr:ADP-glyceromanno-heptose 6-epimerase [Marivirga sp.]